MRKNTFLTLQCRSRSAAPGSSNAVTAVAGRPTQAAADGQKECHSESKEKQSLSFGLAMSSWAIVPLLSLDCFSPFAGRTPGTWQMPSFVHHWLAHISRSVPWRPLHGRVTRA